MSGIASIAAHTARAGVTTRRPVAAGGTWKFFEIVWKVVVRHVKWPPSNVISGCHECIISVRACLTWVSSPPWLTTSPISTPSKQVNSTEDLLGHNNYVTRIASW